MMKKNPFLNTETDILKQFLELQSSSGSVNRVKCVDTTDIKKLTRFQARYIQFLSLNDCSLRAIAGNFYGRYNDDMTRKNCVNDYDGWGANQLDGIELVEACIEYFKKEGIDPLISVY
jgi:hypothetical protein